MTGHGTFEKTVRVGALRSLALTLRDSRWFKWFGYWKNSESRDWSEKTWFFGRHSKCTHCFGTHPGRTARLLIPDAPGQGWCKVKVVKWNVWELAIWCRAQLGPKVIGLRYWPQVESVWKTGPALFFCRCVHPCLRQLCCSIAVPIAQTSSNCHLLAQPLQGLFRCFKQCTLCWSSPSVLKSLEACVN